MLNRGAFTLRCKQPVVDWLDTAFPIPRERAVTLQEANRELTVYLVSDATVESPAAFRRWLKRNYKALFETELEGWCTDPDLWPKNLTYALFESWFEAELHSVVVDLVGTAIHDDDF